MLELFKHGPPCLHACLVCIYNHILCAAKFLIHFVDTRCSQWFRKVGVCNKTKFGDDTTLASPLTRSGEPTSRGGIYAGAVLQDARRTKERTYPELLRNRRCRLVVLGIEVRGGWSNEASSFIRMLTQARARSSPPSLRAATASALVSRWSALLSHLRCQSPV